VLRSNVQLQLAPGHVMVARVKEAVGTLRVRRRLAVDAEVLVLLHALGLGHAADGAAVRDQAVFIIDPVEGTTVASGLEMIRGALPGVPCGFACLFGGLEEHVEEEQVLDLLLARGRRGVHRNVRQRVELVEDGGEGVCRGAPGSEALDEELRRVSCEVCCNGAGAVGGRVRLHGLVGGGRGPAALELRKHVCHCEFCLCCCLMCKVGFL